MISDNQKIGEIIRLFVATPRDNKPEMKKYNFMLDIVGRVGPLRDRSDYTWVFKKKETDPAFFTLYPIEKIQALPLLCVTYNFKGENTKKIALKVILLHGKNSAGIKAFGLRFEAPEGEGIHNYYHSQLIREFEKGKNRFDEFMCPWVPAAQPALCLDASNPVQLTVAFFVSLYGLTEVSQRICRAECWAEIKSDIAGMHLEENLKRAA